MWQKSTISARVCHKMDRLPVNWSKCGTYECTAFAEAVFQASRKNQKSGEKDREDGEERVRRKSGVF